MRCRGLVFGDRGGGSSHISESRCGAPGLSYLCRPSAEALVGGPVLRPGLVRWAADEDFEVASTFLVDDAGGVAVVAGEAAVGEGLVGVGDVVEAEDDERGGLGRWIAAQPGGVGERDGRGQVVGGAENLDGALLA